MNRWPAPSGQPEPLPPPLTLDERRLLAEGIARHREFAGVVLSPDPAVVREAIELFAELDRAEGAEAPERYSVLSQEATELEVERLAREGAW